MYPKLVAYHNWWYTNRDIDKNGIAEYGGMVHETCYDWRNYGYEVGQVVEGFGTCLLYTSSYTIRKAYRYMGSKL